MKKLIHYIVVHSTQTLPTELHYAFPFHYIIYRNGILLYNKRITKEDRSIHIAYIGGINKKRAVCDTRTEQQNETMFRLLFLLTEKYPKAKVTTADEIFGKTNDPGFEAREWLQTYIPKSINPAA